MFEIEDKGRKNFENGMGSEAWGLGKKLQNRPDAMVGVSVSLRHNCIKV